MSTLDLTKKVSNSGLFAPLLDLSTSEAGVFGCYREEDTFKILNIDASTRALKIKEEHAIRRPKNVVGSAGRDQTIIIGNNFYVIRDGKFILGVNLISKSTFDMKDGAIQIPELLHGPGTFVSYNPGQQSIQQSSAELISQVFLAFQRQRATTTTATQTIPTTNSPATGLFL